MNMAKGEGGGGDYIGGESEFDSSSRREAGSSRRRTGARSWEKEKGMLVVNWVDMAEEEQRNDTGTRRMPLNTQLTAAGGWQS